MTTENRDFKGVWIPKEVWLDSRLSAIEKIVFVEIDSLDSTGRGCWASNKYIAEFCQCSERTVSAAISKLTKLGYVYVQAFDGRQRELKSKYTVVQSSPASSAEQPSKICEADTQELRESNTSIDTLNNTDNKYMGQNEKTVEKGTRFKPPTVEEVLQYCLERQNNIDAKQFVDYYTSKGWLVGKSKMKDWKAAVRNWERNNFSKAGKNYNGETVVINGKEYIKRGSDYYIPNGNNIAVDPYAVDDLPF